MSKEGTAGKRKHVT